MLRKLRRDQSGATVVEFGLLLPVILGGFLGVLQVGIATLYYNGLRNATAEGSRWALTQYQASTNVANSAIRTKIIGYAPGSGLNTNKLTVTVSDAATQRVEGALERSIKTKYLVPSVLPFLGLKDFTVTYERPLFLIDNTV